MSTSVYTGLNPFNFISKQFMHIYVQKVAVYLQKLFGSDVHERLYTVQPNLRTLTKVHSDIPNAR
jgi:pyruvate formate-lyase activating enzyme-like uncharacterized protein